MSDGIRKKAVLCAAAMATALLAGCSSGSGGGGDVDGGPDVPDMDSVAVDRMELDQIIDGVRLGEGEGVLAMNAELNTASQDYAIVLDDVGTIDHVGPDGSTVSSRAAAAGYEADFLAENLALGPSSSEEAMDAWMASPSHRANILHPLAEDFGLGHEGATWVLMLGSPL